MRGHWTTTPPAPHHTVAPPPRFVWSCDQRKQVFFYTLAGNPHFRLLFDTGPNSDFSARFVLGFPSEDTPFKQYHFGHNMTSDIGLHLRREECELLVTDLFQKFDNDDSGDLSFEEFRDFYLQLLDTEAGLKLLRRYTKYRFKVRLPLSTCMPLSRPF